jgi:hypothetical protein
MGWVVNATPGCSTAGKETRYHFQRELVVASGPVWAGAENLAPNRDSIPVASRK